MRKSKLLFLSLLILSVTIFLSGCGFTNQSPTASFSASPASGKSPLEVNLDASSSNDPDGYISTYEWEFGDGDTEEWSFSSTTHTFDSTGNYTVKLTVYDDEGASDSVSKQISVSGQKLEIVDWTLEESLVGDWVEGKVKNVCGKTIDYAEIKAKFYNSNDNRVGSNFTNITDFEAGEVWEFEINSFQSPSEVDHAEIEIADVSFY